MEQVNRFTRVVDVTLPGRGPFAQEGGERSDGEGWGVAYRQRTVLVERENKAQNLNVEIPGRPSANPGRIPVVGMGTRKTGRIA